MKYAVALAVMWAVGAALWAVSADGWLDWSVAICYAVCAINYTVMARQMRAYREDKT